MHITFPKKWKKVRLGLAIIAVLILEVAGTIAYMNARSPGSAKASWFDNSWSFRQRMPITNATGSTQTNFQVMLTVDTATLITGGKLQSNCNDIRITNAGGSLLPYWIEPTTCNTATTKIWVKLDSLPSTNGDIYLYYGNPSATAPVNNQTKNVFIRDMSSAAANWPLDDTTTTQSYSRVINPAVTTGRNTVINGTFDTDTLWTKGTGWSIANGVAHAAGTVSPDVLSLNGNVVVTIGKAYQTTFTISNYSGSGSVKLQVGNASASTLRSANGTYTETVIAVGTANYIQFQESSTPFTGDIDNVIVTQVNIPAYNSTATQLLADGDMEAAGTGSWTAINSATLTKQTGTPHGGSQVLRIARNGVNFPQARQVVLTIGQVYRITGYARSDGNSGNTPTISDGTQTPWTGTTSTLWQPFDVVIKAGGTGLFLQSNTTTGTEYVEFDDVVVSVDNFIRSGELVTNGGFAADTDWTKGTGWTISGGVASSDGTGVSATLSQAGVLALGKTYYVTYTISSYTSGTLRVQAGSSTNGTNRTAAGTYTETLIAAGSTSLLFQTNTAFVGSIDNVSVVELDPLVGKPTNGVTLGSAAGGHLTNAYSFDGTNDNVNIYSSDLNSAFNPSEGTLVAWAKVSGAGVWSDGQTRNIIQVRADSSNLIGLQKAATQLNLAYIANGTQQNVLYTTTTTSWFQLAITWNKSADQVKAYFNGSQQGSTGTGLGTWIGNLSSTQVVIGSVNSTGSQVWSGLINDVRVYTRALSAAEIADQYSASTDIQAYTTTNYNDHELLRKYNDSVTVGSAASEETGSGPNLYWKLDNGTGTSASDASGNGNTGTLGGTTIPTWQTEDLCIFGKCLFFDGATSKVTGSKIARNIQTVSFWIRPNTIATQGLLDLDGGTHKLSTNASGVISAGGFSSPTYYVNGQSTATPTLVLNKWNYITVTTATGFNSTASFTVGTDGTNFQKGFIDDVKFYPYARSAAQVKSDYLQGAGKIGSSAVLGLQTTDPLNKGLVGYWKTDEATWSGTLNEIVDSSGNSVHGTAAGATGGKAYPTGGKFGNGGFFDGVDDYVDVPGGTSITFGGDMTVSAWMKTSSAAQRPILSNRTSGGTGTGRFYFGINSGKAFLYHNPASPAGVTAVTSINNNAWHLLTYVRSGTTTNIYVDGVLDKTTTQTNYVNGAKAIRIGHDVDNVTEYFPGNIDEVRIYNRALSPDEVRQLYTFAPGPVGWWKMDEGNGTNANDNSSNGNTGTLTNGPTWTQGKFGKALSFDGSDDFVRVTDPASGVLDFGLGGMTVEGWFKSTQTPTTTVPLIDKKSGGSNDAGYNLNWDTSGRPVMRIANGTTQSSVTATGTPINDGNWHYVTGTLERDVIDRLRIYVDGKLINSANVAATGWNINSIYNLDIGQLNNNSFRFLGLIDDVRVYNYARTNQQIVEDMNAGHPTGGSPLGTQIIYWKLNEQQGNTINNSGFGGTTYNGTNSGAAWLTNAVCKNNGCLNFDTTTDTVSAGDVAFVDASASISASLWVNPQTLATNKMILSKANTTTQRVFQIKTDDTTAAKLKVMISSSSTDTSNYCVTSASVLTASTWQQVSVVYDGTQGTGNDTKVKVYVNGILKSCTVTGTIPGTLVSGTTSNLKLGQGDDTTPTALISFIDDVKIYNSALTADQVKIDYNAGASLNFGTGAASESAQLSDGPGNPPVAYWNFDEHSGTSAFDKSGNGRTATFTGTGTHWGVGKFGTAGVFNGTDDYASFTTTGALTTFTANAWIKTTSSTDPANIFSDVNGVTASYYISVRTNKAGWYDGNDWRKGTTTINDGKWHFVSFVFNSGAHYIYVDGKIEYNNTAGNGTYASGSFTHIGRLGNIAQRFFNGSIDNITIYNYARTAAQVAYDYNRGAPVGWWKFDECQGATTNDSSGNGNRGTITIGASGTQTAIGTCNTSSTAWGNGATGKFNASLNFDGTDDYVDVGDLSSTESQSQVSWSMWLNSSSLNTIRCLFCKFNVTDNTQTSWVIETGTVATRVLAAIPTTTSDGNTFGQTPSGVLANNTWAHIVIVFDGTQSGNSNRLKIYVDGISRELSFTGTIPATTQATTSNARIGSFSDGTAGRFFNGKIDDVRIYNYALSASQVKTVYDGGAAVRYGPSTGSP